MFNKAFLIGRLTRDPDVRVTLSGITTARFTIAIDRIQRRDAPEKITDFIRVSAWRRLGEICGQYMKKGHLVSIEGRLQISEYQKDGETRSLAEIVADSVQMLERKGTQNIIEEGGFSNMKSPIEEEKVY